MVIRLLDLRQFDRNSKRFRDTLYRHSAKPADPKTTPDGRGGISVILAACACQNLECDCFCEYIGKFSSQSAPEPCAFVQFTVEELPISDVKNPPTLVEKLSTTGDPCHRNLHNISDNRFEKKLRCPEAEPSMRFCVDGHC